MEHPAHQGKVWGFSGVKNKVATPGVAEQTKRNTKAEEDTINGTPSDA
jgi:hypothetical protein